MRGILLEFEDGSGDGATGARCPVDGGLGDVFGSDEAARGRGVFGEGFGPVGGKAVVKFDLVFVLGEGPADVELVEADLFGAVSIGEVAGHCHEPSFADGVGEHVGLPAMGEDAADVDDTSLTLLESGKEMANELKRGAKIHRNDTIEEGHVGVFQMSTGGKGGVVDEAVKPAEAGEGIGGDLCRGIGVLEVALDKGGVVSSDFLTEGVGAFEIAAVEDDFGAFGDEEAGHGGTDAGGATGDEDDLVLESHDFSGKRALRRI